MKNKLLFLGIVLTFTSSLLTAQVKVGDNYKTIDESAIFEIESSTQGFLPPRLSEAERDAISNPAEGLVIYNKDVQCLEFYNATEWISLCEGADLDPDPDPDTGYNCGAYLADGEWVEFDCFNLGADRSVVPFIPSRELHGNYYIWGNPNPVADSNTEPGDILGWFDIPLAEGDAWLDNEKTALDPCPEGYRVPTSTQLNELIENNDFTIIGPWEEGISNWNSGFQFGQNLYIPATGYRVSGGGSLTGRGSSLGIWSSTNAVPPPYGPGGQGLSAFMDISTSYQMEPFVTNTGLRLGASIRCIKE